MDKIRHSFFVFFKKDFGMNLMEIMDVCMCQNLHAGVFFDTA